MTTMICSSPVSFPSLITKVKFKRGGIKATGSESESSDGSNSDDDNSQNKQEQVDDMFIDNEDDHGFKKPFPLSTNTNQFKLKDGQEASSFSSDEEDEQVHDGDNNTVKRQKKIPIIPYNTDQDLEEGDFDQNGHFVKKSKLDDAQSHHDSWLTGVTKKEMKKAKVLEERRAARRIRMEMDVDSNKIVGNGVDEWLALLSFMKPGESVLKSLANNRPQEKQKNQSWKKKQQAKASLPQHSQIQESTRKQAIEKISELCDTLMSLGNTDVYDQKYEQIVRKLRIAEILNEDFIPGGPLPPPNPLSTKQKTRWWEYKLSLDADEVFGPFSAGEMGAWEVQFGGCVGFCVREVKDGTSCDPFKEFVLYSGVSLTG